MDVEAIQPSLLRIRGLACHMPGKSLGVETPEVRDDDAACWWLPDATYSTVHPGPPEDPYLSLETVQHLDRLLDDLRNVRKGISQHLREAEEISAVQTAAL